MAWVNGCGCGLDEVHRIVLLVRECAIQETLGRGSFGKGALGLFAEVGYAVSDGRQLSQWKLCLAPAASPGRQQCLGRQDPAPRYVITLAAVTSRHSVLW